MNIIIRYARSAMAAQSICYRVIGLFVIVASSAYANPTAKDFDVYFSSWQVLHRQIRESVADLSAAVPDISERFLQINEQQLRDEKMNHEAQLLYNAAEKEIRHQFDLDNAQLLQRDKGKSEAMWADYKLLESQKQSSLDAAKQKYFKIHSPDASDEYNDLKQKYPGLAIIDNGMFSNNALQSNIQPKNEEYITDPVQLTHIIQEALVHIDGRAPDQCIDTSHKPPTLRHSKDCDRNLEMCKLEQYESRDGGGLVAKVLKDDLTVEYVELDTLQDNIQLHKGEFFSADSSIAGDFAFNACAAISYTGERLKSEFSNYLAVTANTPNWAKSPNVTPWMDKDNFKKECIDLLPIAEISNRLESLLFQYSNSVVVPTLNIWKENMALRRNLCAKSVPSVCAQTYSLGGTQVISYETIGCKIMEATRNDITNTMQYSDTDVHRIQMSLLRDTVDICQQAKDVGYWWDYRPATLGSECQSKKPTTHQKEKSQ